MMKRRSKRVFGLAGGAVLCLAALAAIAAQGATQGELARQRIAFQISTGSTSGTYFPVGEFLAGLLSHPPGISRCQAANVCGPLGLIVSTRATEGSVANVVAVNSGASNSALAQADVVALAVAGEGPFKKSGPARQVRIIGDLYTEDLHLIAGSKTKIKSVEDLRGKRVSLSTEGSGTIVTARAVLAAYRVPEWRITASFETPDRAADLLRQGKIDAMFFVGGTPVSLVEQLLDEGAGVLVPINGAGRKRLLAEKPYLSAHTITAATYTNAGAVDTVGTGALWITNASQSDDLIYGMTKALYNPLNRPMIEARHLGANFLESSVAAKGATAPFHPGAARYFTEAKLMPAKPAAKKS